MIFRSILEKLFSLKQFEGLYVCPKRPLICRDKFKKTQIKEVIMINFIDNGFSNQLFMNMYDFRYRS